MRSVADAKLQGKRVLLRADLNVALESGPGGALRVAEPFRIRESLPTIELLIDNGAKAVCICSHLGRPKGRDSRLSLAPIAAWLADELGLPVPLLPDSVGVEIPDGVSLLENLRFHPEEERNDPEFAKRLAAPFDVYVNDAFGAAHRAHASTEGVARLLPAYAGLLLAKEVAVLSRLLRDPERPFLAIVGGAKVSSKIGVLRALVATADAIAIGGGMANTFLSATGHEVGTSLREPDKEDEARAILRAAKERELDFVLPSDVVCAPSADAPAGTVHDVGRLPADQAIVDVGPRTLDDYERVIAGARTIFWNGPVGVFEREPFAAGTRRVAELVANARATTVVGGGESVQAVRDAGLASRLTHLSTGGGAALELIEGRRLPGVAAIPD